jgi:hypothetical protein
MLPVSYQLPAAIILLAGGLLACFAGFRVFRVVLGIYGFILGALIASSAMGTEQTTWTILAAIGGGVIGALILIAAYFVGVALVGAGLGALAVNLIAGELERDPHVLVVILFAILGALGALALQRYVIIIGTSFGGAWTAIVGGLAIAGERGVTSAAARGDVWLAYPLNPAPGQRWVLVAWLGLGIIGVVVQLAVTARGKE